MSTGGPGQRPRELRATGEDGSVAAERAVEATNAPPAAEDTGQNGVLETHSTGIVEAEVVDPALIPDQYTGEVALPSDARGPEVLTALATGPQQLPAPWAAAAPERRPVIAGWVRDAQQRQQAARWFVGYLGHVP